MTEQTITAKTPTGTEYTATATMPENSQRTSFKSRMIFEVEVPAKEISFKGFFNERKGAIMGRSKVGKKHQEVGVKVTEEVRRFVEECERPIREAEAAEEARIEEIVSGIQRVNHATVESADGLYSHHTAHDGYVSIDSALSGLPDNTVGKVGKFQVYLQHPDECVSEELLAGARDFYRAVSVFEEREETDLREAASKLLDDKEQREEDEAFERAEATGERQVIRRYTTGCNSPHEECSTDVVTVWAIPNGFRSKETTRTHTW